MKRALLEAIRSEIIKCFKGLDLRIVSDDDNKYELRDFESVPLHFYVYDSILALAQSSDEDQWAGYDKHQKTLERYEDDPKMDKDSSAQWGDLAVHVRVPKELRPILAEGVYRFRSFIENVERSELMNRGNDTPKEVKTLQQKRDDMIKELDLLLYYSSFLGNCKYLK